MFGGRTMALGKEGEWYTSFRFTENGESKVRRIQRMHIQASDGYLHVFEGEQLPDVIEAYTGKGHSGKHLATILLNRKNFTPLDRARMKDWPSIRDGLHVLMGLGFFILLFWIGSILVKASH